MALTAPTAPEPIVRSGEPAKAPVASTIVIVREDLSLPGSDRQDGDGSPEAIERRFFDLLQDKRPDVVVLDLARTQGGGIEAIRKIRERNGVPILAVCGGDDPHVH